MFWYMLPKVKLFRGLEFPTKGFFVAFKAFMFQYLVIYLKGLVTVSKFTDMLGICE